MSNCAVGLREKKNKYIQPATDGGLTFDETYKPNFLTAYANALDF